MERTWKESIKIPDEKHQGSITKVVERKEPYEYIDIFVKPNNFDVELKYGCPDVLSERSKLGKLMETFNTKFEKDKTIDMQAILVGKQVEFMTLTKKNKDGNEYAEIVDGSLKPIQAESA